MRGGSRSSRYAGRDAVDAAASGARREAVGGAPPENGLQGPLSGALMEPQLRGADDHAARCGPGRRFALFVSPLRAGPSRVVPTPVAGAKGAERLRPTGPQETTGQTSGLPDSSIPTVTNKAYQSPPGRARSKPKKPPRAERRAIRCFRGD
jgi:hypothetical protein